MRIAHLARPMVALAILLLVSLVMWRLGASALVAAAWFGIAGAALVIDRRAGRLFTAGVAVATAVAGVLSGVRVIETMPDQTARRLLMEFLPTLPTVLRPLLVTLGLWSFVVALGFGVVRSVTTARFRPALVAAASVAIVFAGFSYVMLVAWPDPTLSHQLHKPPLGINEDFFHEHPAVDLAEFMPVPPRPPVPIFEVRQGLSYGPHGYRNTLDLYLPQGEPGPLPVVIYIHGGGTMDGGTEAGDLPDVWRDALLARGLAIAFINYRLIFADQNSKHDEVTGPFPAQIQDCLAAVRYLRAEAGSLGLDPDHIGVMGHSFGGCLASMVGLAWDDPQFLTDTRRGVSSRVQAVVNSAGMTDLRIIGPQVRLEAKLLNLGSAEYIQPEDFVSKYCGTSMDRCATSKAVADASPMTHIRPDAPPFLIVYGTRDEAVQGELFYEHLKASGAPARFLLIPGAGHALANVAGTGDIEAEFLRERLVAKAMTTGTH